MSIYRTFAYNPSRSPIPGTNQVGDLAIGVSEQNYYNQPGGVQWWNGPDEDTNGFIIARPIPSGDHPNPLSIPCSIGFWETEQKTDASFISFVNGILKGQGQPLISTVSEAYSWITTQGYWTNKEAPVANFNIDPFDVMTGYTTSSYPPSNNTSWQLYFSHQEFKIKSSVPGSIGTGTYQAGSNSTAFNISISTADNTLGSFGAVTVIKSQSFSYIAGGLNVTSPASDVTIPANRYFLFGVGDSGLYYRTILPMASEKTINDEVGNPLVTIKNRIFYSAWPSGPSKSIPSQIGGTSTGYTDGPGYANVYRIIATK